MNELELEYDQGHEIDPDTQAFELHPQLAADTVLLGQFPLCDLLLMNDSQYPWFILVPRVPGVSEIHHLSVAEQQQLLRESSYLAENLSDIFNATKMNIAALGNIVPQLHLHHVVRHSEDRAWPGPVWGRFPAQAYTSEQIQAIQRKVGALLEQRELFEPVAG